MRRRRPVRGLWDEPTYADSTLGDNVDGEDLEVRRAAVEALGPFNGSVVVTTSRGRYSSARLIVAAGAWLPDLVDDRIANCFKIYRQTNADVKGGSESSGGQSKPKEDLGGDGRCLAAHALSLIGPRVKQRHPKIIGLLKELAKSKDPLNQEYARLALEKIGE